MIRKVLNNSFFKNVITLASGTVISQLLVVAISPVLSRIYTIEAFGLFSVFTSITTILAVLATGRYEYAIGLPTKDKDALSIVKLIIFIGACISFFYFILIVIFKNQTGFHDQTGFLSTVTSYFAPLYIFFIALNSGYGYWFHRLKKYKKIAFSNIVQVSVTIIFNIALGLFGIEEGMIYSLIIGVVSANIYFYWMDPALRNILSSKANILSNAKEHVSFPKYMILSDLSKTAGQQLVPVLFSVLYSTTVVGLFSLANRMLRLPSIVITTAIANVFRNEAIDEIRANGNCEKLFRSTLKKLLVLSLPIYIVTFVIAPVAFKIVFGEKWIQAGYYARILTFMLMIEFIVSPLFSVFYIRQKQKLFMLLQFLGNFIGGLMIYAGFSLFNSPTSSLIAFVANSVIFNLVIAVFSYKIAKND